MTDKPTYEELEKKVQALEAECSQLRGAAGFFGKDEERFRTLVENVVDWVWEVDENGVYTYVSPQVEAITGYEVSEIVGKTPFDFMTPDEAKRVGTIFSEIAAKRERIVGLEDRMIAKDSREVVFETNATPMFDETGTFVGYLGTCRDVTKAKYMDKALSDSEAQYRNLIESLQEGIWMIDEDARTSLVNGLMADMLGYTQAEMQGRAIFDFMDEEGVRIAKEQLARRESGISEQHDFEFVHRDGTTVHTILETKPLIDDDGNFKGAIAGVINVTKRKRAEDEVRQKNTFLQTVMDAIPISVFYKDASGIYTGCNKAYSEFLGLPKEEIIGKSVYDLFTKDLADRYAESDQRLFRNPGTHFYEGKMDHADGSRRSVLFNKATFLDEDGKVAGLIGAMLDITERKQAQQLRADLEFQLRHAQKMEAIGTLAGGIAHDFNNVLGIIIGNVELAKDDILPGNPARYSLDEARQACLRAKDMVKQILAFSRRENNEHQSVDIQPTVKEALKMLRSSVPTTIDIQQDISMETAVITGDPTQIHQILMNLCANAVQAMEEMGSVLQVGLAAVELDEDAVRALPELSAGRYVRLTVSDTGHGIRDEILSRIFDPYFTTKAVGQGTGMGLAVVDGIVREHGSAITVYSEEGKGTTFHVFFPQADAGCRTSEAADVPIPRGEESILFVDDESALVNLGKRMLDSLGYTVKTTTRPTEALELFRTNPDAYDLVITDMTMPHLTGEVLAKELMAVRPDIPVVLCTGFSQRIDDKKAAALGIREFVMKPLVLKDLAQAVRRALDPSS